MTVNIKQNSVLNGLVIRPVLPIENTKDIHKKIKFNKEGYEQNKEYGNLLVTTNFVSLFITLFDLITPCAIQLNTKKN